MRGRDIARDHQKQCGTARLDENTQSRSRGERSIDLASCSVTAPRAETIIDAADVFGARFKDIWGRLQNVQGHLRTSWDECLQSR